MTNLELTLGIVIPLVVLLAVLCFLGIRRKRAIYQLDPTYRRQNFERTFSRRVNISRTSSKKGLIPGIFFRFDAWVRDVFSDSESVSSHFSTDRRSSLNTVAWTYYVNSYTFLASSTLHGKISFFPTIANFAAWTLSEPVGNYWVQL